MIKQTYSIEHVLIYSLCSIIGVFSLLVSYLVRGTCLLLPVVVKVRLLAEIGQVRDEQPPDRLDSLGAVHVQVGSAVPVPSSVSSLLLQPY